MRPWRPAIRHALYGPTGFFVTDRAGPAAHFRTSAHASPLFAEAIARLAARHELPTVVDVGAGRGELVINILKLRKGLELVAVDLADPPADLPPEIEWRRDVPDRIDGLLIANEWLDNVPVDVAQVDDDGQARLVLVAEDGTEELGPVVAGRDAEWLRRWWPLSPPGSPGRRAEIGWPRDDAWAAAVGAVRRGMAVAVDYGHTRDSRPTGGTLTGYRRGRQVPPVPDGSCDLTAHVAVDAVADAVAGATGGAPVRVLRQREALHELGISGRRPDLELARRDPAGYLRALAAAAQAGELTDGGGLGGHHWVCVSI
jgi:SAM-dependent MidA family methyltransferase